MGAPIGNQNAIGNQGGRPPFYETPEELQEAIDNYFEFGAHKKQHITQLGNIVEIPTYTICGLALYLGFSTRKSLVDYSEKIEFVSIIKKAMSKIEMMYEENLQGSNCTGSIFALKNMGWHDKTEHDVTSGGEKLSIAPIEWVNGQDKDK